MVAVKKLILDQLQKLADKFESASQENVECYKEMKKKIASIIEEFCTIDFDKKVGKYFDNFHNFIKFKYI